MSAAHRSAPPYAMSLEFDGIVITEIVRGEGEADDCFVSDRENAAAKAALFVNREFERSRDAERVELAAGGVEEGFGIDELFDGDAARVKRGGGCERAGAGDAEAEGVACEVEATACKGQHVAVVIGGDAQAQGCAARREDDDTLPPRDAAQKLNAEP